MPERFLKIQRPSADEWLLLRVFLILSNGFGAFSLVFSALKSAFLLGGASKVSLPWETLIHSSSLAISVFGYLSVYVAMHLLFGFAIWLLFLPLARRMGGERNLQVLRGIVVFIAFSWWLILFHSLHYPNSLMAVGIDTPQFKGAFPLLSAGLAVLIGFSFYNYLNHFPKNRWGWALSVLLVGWSAGAFAINFGKAGPIRSAREGLPDVIVIGIDSLRPDHLQRLGFVENLTPHLNEFLDQAAVFANTSTPLARTFPSWVSLLTGLEPINHGGRFNLMPTEKVHSEKSIAHVFQRRGYRTIYATDESRFSNIDSKFGFAEVLAPPYGFGDFLLGGINDAPLMNLLVNSPVGRTMMPFSHANRAAHTTYRPETFDSGLRQLIGPGDARPLFLAVHFCLPHWPYKWNEKTNKQFPGYNNSLKNDNYQSYLNSLHRVDRQFGTLMSYLRAEGRLENTLVVVISDHGESFMLDKDRLYSTGTENRLSPLPQQYGHAVSVVDSSQYRVMLAFRAYGDSEVIAGTFQTPVSLIDVAPTILRYAFAENIEDLDGLSLDEAIRGRGSPPTDRVFFRESGFTVPAILDFSPDMTDAFHQGAGYYNLDPLTGRLELKDEFLGELLRNKQRAIVMGRWILTFLPEGEEISVSLVDSEAKRFWPERELADAAGPTAQLICELCRHYQDEAELLPERLCNKLN